MEGVPASNDSCSPAACSQQLSPFVGLLRARLVRQPDSNGEPAAPYVSKVLVHSIPYTPFTLPVRRVKVVIDTMQDMRFLLSRSFVDPPDGTGLKAKLPARDRLMARMHLEALRAIEWAFNTKGPADQIYLGAE